MLAALIPPYYIPTPRLHAEVFLLQHAGLPAPYIFSVAPKPHSEWLHEDLCCLVGLGHLVRSPCGKMVRSTGEWLTTNPKAVALRLASAEDVYGAARAVATGVPTGVPECEDLLDRLGIVC